MIDLSTMRLWLSGTLYLNSNYNDGVSKLLQHIYRSNVTNLDIFQKNLNYDDLMFLIDTRALKKLKINTRVFYSNGKEAPMEDLIAMVPRIEHFE